MSDENFEKFRRDLAQERMNQIQGYFQKLLTTVTFPPGVEKAVYRVRFFFDDGTHGDVECEGSPTSPPVRPPFPARPPSCGAIKPATAPRDHQSCVRAAGHPSPHRAENGAEWFIENDASRPASIEGVVVVILLVGTVALVSMDAPTWALCLMVLMLGIVIGASGEALVRVLQRRAAK